MIMRCNKARRFLSQAMDEQLPPAETRELALHLDECADCREFQSDLATGRRLLNATAPVLPDSFEWRLQLKLKQALQQSAGETAYPWQDSDAKTKSWVSPFATAASLGLAAVLALAMFLAPASQGPMPAGDSRAPASGSPTVASRVSDRLPLVGNTLSPFSFPGSVQRSVSRDGAMGIGASARSFHLNPGWSGNSIEDLMTIQDLRLRNQQLNNQLYQYQNQIRLLRARLDRADSNGIDLGK